MSLQLLLGHQAVLAEIQGISDARCICNLMVASKSFAVLGGVRKIDGNLLVGLVVATNSCLTGKLLHIHLPSMKGLEFSCSDLNCGSAALAISNAKLQRLVVKPGRLHRGPPSASAAEVLFSSIKTARSIRFLDVSTVALDSKNAALLVGMLKDGWSIEELIAANCGLGRSSSSVFAALAGNSSVKTLDLSSNSISEGGRSVIGASIKQMLTKNASLQKLALGSNDLRSTGAKAVLEALVSNSTLTSLDLRNNFLQYNELGQNASDTVEAAASALSVNCALRELNIVATYTCSGSLTRLCKILGKRGNLSIDV